MKVTFDDRMDKIVDFFYKIVHSKIGQRLLTQRRIRNNDGYKFVEEFRFNPYSPFFYLIITLMGIILLVPHTIPQAIREALKWRERN